MFTKRALTDEGDNDDDDDLDTHKNKKWLYLDGQP